MEITSDSVREIFKELRAAMKLRLAMGQGISRTRLDEGLTARTVPGL
jgi:hypothetical protein